MPRSSEAGPVRVPGRFGKAIAEGRAPSIGWRWAGAVAHLCAWGAFVYGIGWGPVTIPTFGLIIAFDIQTFGPSFRYPLLGISAVVVGTGQLAVEQGWVASELHGATAHHVAIVGSLIVVLTCVLLGRTALGRAEAEARLAGTEARFRLLAEASPIGVAHVDATGHVVYANERTMGILGLGEVSPVGLAWHSLLEAEGVRRLNDAYRRGRLDAGVEVPFRRDDDRPSWVRVRVAELEGGEGFVATIADVSEEVATRERLRRDASHDFLTGLLNRSSFLTALDEIAATLPAGESCGVVFADLDGFKQVNDTHGHAAGDELLVQVGERIAEALRVGDIVARLGGDEFAVLLCGSDKDAAIAAVERIDAELRRPFQLTVADVTIGVSIGLVMVDRAGASPASILRHADLAMYRAKSRAGGYEVAELSALFD